MLRSSKNTLSYLRLTMLAVVVVTLAACGGSPETEQDRSQKASARIGTTESTTAGSTTRVPAMGAEKEATGMESGMGGMAVPDNVQRLPPVKAYYEGEEVFFVHPEASDRETADLLTNMMGSPVLVVPELEQVPDEALAKVYVFTNGIRGDGPLGFQPDVFDSAPGDEDYSPLRRLYLVTWKNESEAREIKTLRGVIEAQESGEAKIEPQDTVINEPFLTWPDGQR
jgi:hypothetical protein